MKHSELQNRYKEICKMITDGKSLNEVASYFNLSESTIKQIYPSVIDKLPDKNIKRNKEIFERIVSGESYQQAGDKYGLTKERVRQIYRKAGGILTPFRKKQKQRTFNKGLRIAEEYMKGKKVFPYQKEILQVLTKNHSSGYVTEIYETLKKKYRNLPTQHVIKQQTAREKMLDDLKKLYAEVKMPLSLKYHLKKYGLKSAMYYRYCFGSFRNACKIAGVPCGQRGGDARKKSRVIRKSMKQ